MYIDHLRVDPVSLCPVFSRCCVSAWLAFSRTHDTRLLFFFFFELSNLLIAIRLLPHHLPSATGLFVISLCRFFTLRPSLPSLETTQKHPVFFPSNARQKFPTLYIFTRAQSFHHLPSLPDSPHPRFYVTPICSFAGDVLPHFITGRV